MRRNSARWAACACVLMALALGFAACGGDGDGGAAPGELIIKASAMELNPPVVLDTVRSVSRGSLAGSSSDARQRESDLKRWGFRAAAAACFSNPPGCDLTTTNLPDGAAVVDIVLSEFKAADGASKAYAAIASDVARRLENVTANASGTTGEELEGRPAMGDESRSFLQHHAGADGEDVAISHQVVVRDGPYVAVLSILTRAVDYDAGTLEGIAQKQLTELTEAAGAST